MITNTDLNLIDPTYFDIVAIKPYTLTLRSRNTGHYWSLLERIACDHRTFVISHKHHERDPFHLQIIRGSADGGIGAAVEYIVHHDADYLERMKEKAERRERGRRERLERTRERKTRDACGKPPH